ncbi:hypothetical protein [Lysobacter niastensis]|uniref:HEAT repeat domain-containing protein n=1 Tax=Lysobacter niastensis TaxID=380629 RepID=A0ABS0B7U9_9GAMM|nr:hypothetical protein [Lysobacter niastensis]MBF6025104.1 hypothetical protein [Lysobacter niastensis]
MSDALQCNDSVLDAVRAFLVALHSGRGLAESMAAMVRETSGLPLTQLAAWEMMIRRELWTDEARARQSRWTFRAKPGRHLSWLDLCSSDGFRRERVLRSLSAGAPNGFFCALAMRRLNDWVPQVRQAARERLPLIAQCSEPEDVVDGLWSLLPHVTSWGRMGSEDRKLVEDLIAVEPVSNALKARILKATAGPASLILAQAGRSSALDRWLEVFARDAVQPTVRARAYRCLLERRVAWVVGRTWIWTELQWCKGRFEPVLEERSISVDAPFIDVLKDALEDRSSVVRRVAGELLIKQLDSMGTDAIRLANTLASDSSPCVAERGRFALEKLGRPV